MLIALVRSIFGRPSTFPHTPLRSALSLLTLEDRTVLASTSFKWLGTTSTDWQDKANWWESINGQYQAATRYPGSDITVLDDEVVADNTIVVENGQEKHTVSRDLRLSSSEAMTLKSIYVTSTPRNNCTLAWKNFKLIVDNSTALFLGGNNSQDLRFAVEGKYNSVEINSGAMVTVQNGSGFFGSPSLTSVGATPEAAPNGVLNIVAAKFQFIDLAEKLTVSINVRGGGWAERDDHSGSPFDFRVATGAETQEEYRHQERHHHPR